MNEVLIGEAERLHSATAEAIIKTAEARAILERLKLDAMTTSDQIAHAAVNYRAAEAKVKERVQAEVDFYFGVAMNNEEQQ